MSDENDLRWTLGAPPWTDGDALLFQVDLADGTKQTFVGCVDDGGTMVDLEYRDDHGWQAESVDRWIDLNDVLNLLDDCEPRPAFKDEEGS